jgi:hypothetical protein
MLTAQTARNAARGSPATMGCAQNTASNSVHVQAIQSAARVISATKVCNALRRQHNPIMIYARSNARPWATTAGSAIQIQAAATSALTLQREMTDARRHIITGTTPTIITAAVKTILPITAVLRVKTKVMPTAGAPFRILPTAVN